MFEDCICYMFEDYNHIPGINELINSSSPSAAYMRQWIRLALVQIMACRLFCAIIWTNARLLSTGYLGTNLSQGSKLRGAEGQNAPKLSPNAPRLLNLGAKFCYPIQPDICFEA